jgi:prepilin-type N-terminal cleavage/methylation domain-containing protein
MIRSRKSQGFSLIEILLVLAIIGIISGIAIPAFLGQRRRARVIGDALSNARGVSMAMEQFKADSGSYGPVGATARWTPASNIPALVGFAANPCPNFRPQANTRMNFLIQVGTTLDPATGVIAAGGTGRNYTISISDSVDATNTIFVEMNEDGATWRRPGY